MEVKKIKFTTPPFVKIISTNWPILCTRVFFVCVVNSMKHYNSLTLDNDNAQTADLCCVFSRKLFQHVRSTINQLCGQGAGLAPILPVVIHTTNFSDTYYG